MEFALHKYLRKKNYLLNHKNSYNIIQRMAYEKINYFTDNESGRQIK